jgi:tRNA (guanine10-N2)-methyltransferase
MRKQFDFLERLGPVKLKDCDNEYILIREVELDSQGGAVFPRFDQNKRMIVENDQRPALGWYFGRILGNRHLKGRGQIGTYSLKKRAYLGPTSMDTELSLIMTNLAHVRPGSMVIDPFVGTGSILLVCASRGACCVGTDIDIRVLRGKGSEQTVFANFAQYGLPRPELIRSDNALYDRHFCTDFPLYDAIVTDPPYGIRAGARRSGSCRDNPRAIPDERRHDHIAQTKPYPVSDVMADLLDMAARTLVSGGRLVYIIPSLKDFSEDDLPRHPCLKLSHVCYQPLSLELGRRMIAMQKVTSYDPSARETYLSNTWKNGVESAEKCANLKAKIIEAAKQKPDYKEKAAARKQKRKENKEARKQAKKQPSTKGND